MTTILVVDDNALERQWIGKSVEAAGWSFEFADNGREALEKLGQKTPDLVLTDLQMPEMDGLELVRQTKARFPATPVVLITAYGSEELAVAALQAGASSYVPKRNLHRDIKRTLEIVLDAANSQRERRNLFEFMTATESHFTLGYDKAGPRALVAYCQDGLRMMNLCDATKTRQVGTALNEALRNALDHGNLELDSSLREADDGSYERLREQRQHESPYRDRRVQVDTRFTRNDATYIIRDEGPGFDSSALPDPTDPENLLKPSGRGIMLMRTFMDDVRYNDRGNEVTLVKRLKLT
ncbi:MAG TPA: response regulator [Lacipirellulaceae bacterium]|jgi:CheY-like chemotaxis protein|nr:response regulator [Lacipirellulaceae bacterium]